MENQPVVEARVDQFKKVRDRVGRLFGRELQSEGTFVRHDLNLGVCGDLVGCAGEGHDEYRAKGEKGLFHVQLGPGSGMYGRAPARDYNPLTCMGSARIMQPA
jgi:hypothetical protein